MQMKWLSLRFVIVFVVFCLGIAIGSIGINLTMATPFDLSQKHSNVPDYPKNEYGMTYGSGSDAVTPDHEPDLIRAYGEDGTIGYVRSIDLKGEMPKTPEMALAQQHLKSAHSVRQIPLYDIDGKTIIGVFNVTTGETIEKTIE